MSLDSPPHPPTSCPSEETLILIASRSIEDPHLAAHIASCPRCSVRLHALDDDETFLSGIASTITHDARPLLSADSHAPGPPIPGYELLDEISRGGQGVVHRARQRSTGRTVAIKTMVAGAFASTRERARFEREIEIAASLSHPGIVTVHHALTTPDGGIAVVMELVAGLSLERWALRARAESPDWPRAAASLVHAVAAAVGHAHRQGIIHRDLKPANIIIDDHNNPHILDFGVARRADHAADLTFTGEFTGTLAYAAPETVRGRGADVRSDVYALGLILYELLAARMPYTVEGTLPDIITHITTTEPAPLHLRGHFGRDLETITLAALAKDPERRYASADALAADLAAALESRPIAARRDSTTYLLRKTITRHWRPIAATAALLAAALSLVIILAISSARTERIARQQAAEQQRADAEAVRSRAVAHVMNLIMPQGINFDTPNPDPADLAILNQLTMLEAEIGQGSYADDPTYEQALRTTIAALYSDSSAMSGRGEIAARQALADSRNLFGPDHANTADAIHTHAEVILGRKRPAEAEAEAARAVALRTRVLGPDDVRTRASQVLLARARLAQDKPERSLATLNDAIDRQPPLPPDLLAQALVAKARALAALDQPDQAIEAAHLALTTAAASLRKHDRGLRLAIRLAADFALLKDSGIDLARLADELEERTDTPRDEHDIRTDLVAFRRALLPPDHRAIGFELATIAWYTTWQTRGSEFYKIAPRSAALTQEAIAILEAALGPTDPSLAILSDRLASALTNAADYSASADAYARAIAITRAQPPQVRDDISIAVWHRYLAFTLMHAGRITEAEAAARDAITLLTEQFGPDHYIVGHAMLVLAWSRAEQGHTDEALDLARQGRALMAATDATPPDQSQLADCMLGLCLQRAGHHHEAAALLEPVMITLVDWNWHDLRITPFIDALAAAAAALGQPEPPIITTYRLHLAALNAPQPD